MDNNQQNSQKDRYNISFNHDYLGNVISTNECTGLIPSNNPTSDELDPYHDLYTFCTAENNKLT